MTVTTKLTRKDIIGLRKELRYLAQVMDAVLTQMTERKVVVSSQNIEAKETIKAHKILKKYYTRKYRKDSERGFG